MDKATLTNIIRTRARKDMMNHKGRIVLSELRRDLDIPNLTAEEIIEAWRTCFPDIPIDHRTQNIIMVNFGGTRV